MTIKRGEVDTIRFQFSLGIISVSFLFNISTGIFPTKKKMWYGITNVFDFPFFLGGGRGGGKGVLKNGIFDNPTDKEKFKNEMCLPVQIR